jgi:predicted nucleic acid-binding protein
MDEPVLLTAGRLKCENRLSFADALVAAYALREHATLMHKDPEFDALGEEIAVQRLPYKGKNAPNVR